MSYEKRVQAYETQGMTRSDAQAVVDAEDMQDKDFRMQLFDLFEKNIDLDPKQLFGEMIEFAVMGLYDTAPNYLTAQAVINIALLAGLNDHCDYKSSADTPEG